MDDGRDGHSGLGAQCPGYVCNKAVVDYAIYLITVLFYALARCSLLLASTALYRPALHCTLSPCTVLYCPALHCALSPCTWPISRISSGHFSHAYGPPSPVSARQHNTDARPISVGTGHHPCLRHHPLLYIYPAAAVALSCHRSCSLGHIIRT